MPAVPAKEFAQTAAPGTRGSERPGKARPWWVGRGPPGSTRKWGPRPSRAQPTASPPSELLVRPIGRTATRAGVFGGTPKTVAEDGRAPPMPVIGPYGGRATAGRTHPWERMAQTEHLPAQRSGSHHLRAAAPSRLCCEMKPPHTDA
jgi:hypothetical protein